MAKYNLIVVDTGNDIGTLTGSAFTLGVLQGAGPKGAGWTGVSYDVVTGRFVFTSDDGIGYTSDNITADLDAAVASAQAAEAGAIAVFDQFGDQYLGSKASDPTVDNDGDPLTDGDIYFNTTTNVLKFYTGTAWVAPEVVATTAASDALAAQVAAELAESNASTSASNASTSETNANADAIATAADRVQTGLDVITTTANAAATAADLLATDADTIATAADRVQTGLDVITTTANAAATAADLLLTDADTIATAADRVQTGLDAAATAADLLATDADTIATAADRAAVAADLLLTDADTVATAADRAAVAADLLLTDADTVATAADRVQTGLDAAATAADLVQTNIDQLAVAADLVQTNQDTIDTAADVVSANASAVAAALSETNAATSEINAAASYDAFDDRYLGDKASAPTLDNDGNALLTGALYWNTTVSSLYIWSGTVWNQGTFDTNGLLVASNNLSDLNDVATARTNLGLGTAATTASTDYATAVHTHTAAQITDFDTEVSNNASVAANTAKVSNVSTNLSTTAAPTTVTINSSDGTNAIIAAADITNAGVMTTTMYDQHVLNNAKITNATHTGEVTGSTALTIASNVVDADNLNVVGNGTTAQYLRSDGDGSFTWATPTDTTVNQTITLSGDATGSGTTSIVVTVADDSHNHIIGNVDGLQTALDGKSATTHNHALDSLSDTTITLNAAGEILKWSGTAWINNTLAEAGIQPAGSYAAASHTHTAAQITDFDTEVSNNTSVVANTAKVSNATHTGEVTGSTALTIASNVVDADNLNVVGNGTTLQYLRSDGDGSFTWATPPDTDTNTTYSAGTGVTLTGTTFSVVGGTGITADAGGVSLTAGGVGATQLAVTGNGTTSQYLRADGDGTFTWATPPNTNTTYSAGAGINLAGTVFSHTDTSSQGSVNNSGSVYIQDITLDTYGHITNITSSTVPTSAPTTAQVGSATAGLGAGTVGSYAFLRANNTATATSAGTTVSGSTMRYSNVNFDQSGTPSGTWRCMGYTTNRNFPTLYLRIS